ncbi:hypothetical protein BFS06_11605 [Clostridium perfringens]|uniref:Putative growth inhibitor PemK n=1 Tax=Clostridium perfringens TaxID=1502 RepID=A0A140GS29_CLOPF|nr:type II toxin-antitoxin system PemK/MazF family toxin [Clostridium perfringens]AMN31338.1 Putative growth inhibitor PemK [Clostridium perfringens]TBX14859.1 hypothetical protein BFS06_11605 [Clostridium perfringens]
MKKNTILIKEDLENILKTSIKKEREIEGKEELFLDTSNMGSFKILNSFFKESDFDRFLLDVPKALIMSEKEKTLKLKPKFMEVWTVDLAFSVGSEINKVRPCIVISNSFLCGRSNNILVIPITSTDNIMPWHIEIDDNFFTEIKEKTTGVVKMEQLRAVSKGRLGKKVGKVSKEGIIKILIKIMDMSNISSILDIDEEELFNLFNTKMYENAFVENNRIDKKDDKLIIDNLANNFFTT